MTSRHRAPPPVPTGPVSAQTSGPRTRDEEEEREVCPDAIARRRPWRRRLPPISAEAADLSNEQTEGSEDRRAQGLGPPGRRRNARWHEEPPWTSPGGSRSPEARRARRGLPSALVQGRVPAPAPREESSSREGRELRKARHFAMFQLQTVLGVLRGTSGHRLGARGERLGPGCVGRGHQSCGPMRGAAGLGEPSQSSRARGPLCPGGPRGLSRAGGMLGVTLALP